MSKYTYEVLFYPGRYMNEASRNKLVEEMLMVASECFCEAPTYQALSGKKEELDRAVICTSRDESGRLMGFCSALALPVDGVGDVLHLGLTCVQPDARGMNLTHHLTSKLILKYLVKESLFKETWISNCACVLSSLGNVAMYFEALYPSPYGVEKPEHQHMTIAKAIDSHYRESIAINDEATFNSEKFVFEGSVDGTVFEKDSNDERYHHRDPAMTQYYQDLLNFERGDEALQIGKVSLLTFPKYVVRKGMVKLKAAMPKPRKAPTFAN